MRTLLFIVMGGVLAALLYFAGVLWTTWQFWAIFGCAHLMGLIGYGSRKKRSA